MSPTITVFGSYFPAWAACLTVGIACAVVAHAVFKASNFLPALPFPALVYSFTILLGANAFWLVMFL